VKRAFSGVAAATVVGFAFAADARGFDDLRAVCLDTQAEPVASLAAASARGWTPAPWEIVHQVGRPGFPQRSLWKRDANGFSLVYAEVKSDSTGAFKVCRMITRPGEASFRKEAAAWAALPPDEVDGDWVSYQFYDSNGHHLRGDQDAYFGGRVAAKAHFRSLGLESSRGEIFTTFIVPIAPSPKSSH
jgi:hypothetical protein